MIAMEEAGDPSDAFMREANKFLEEVESLKILHSWYSSLLARGEFWRPETRVVTELKGE